MELKYIVYITINTCNGKMYAGVHRTNPDVFDSYIGGGIYRLSNVRPDRSGFHRAVKKYGYENFRRTTIDIFPDTEEGRDAAYDLERRIVTPTFLRSKNTYNVSLGGNGSIQEEDKKRVYMFDLKGEFLRSYETALDAARDLDTENIISTQHAIRNNCLNTSQSALGYFWSYKKEYTRQNNCTRKVAQYTIGGKFLRYFDSIIEAEKELQLCTISQAIMKNGSAGNFQWRYYENDDSNIQPLINVSNKNKVLPIVMINKKTLNKIEYNSVRDCVLENPELQSSQINRVLSGVIKSHKGFMFKYKQDEDIV